MCRNKWFLFRKQTHLREEEKEIFDCLEVQIKWISLQTGNKNGPTPSCHPGITVPVSVLESSNATCSLNQLKLHRYKRFVITKKKASIRTRRDGRKTLRTCCWREGCQRSAVSFGCILCCNKISPLLLTEQIWWAFFSISIVFICPLETFAAVFYLDAMDTSHCATI